MPSFTRAFDLGPDFTKGPEGPGWSLLAHILRQKPKGWALEFGVAKGHTLRMIAEHMPAIGFDWFEGLPEDWRPGFRAGMFRCDPVLDVPGTTVVPGLFADTLPGYDWPDEIGLVHVDCDLYSSTVTVFDNIGHLLKPGTYIAFDEFHSFPTAEEHEARAWWEFVDRTGIEYDVVGHGHEQWAVRIK